MTDDRLTPEQERARDAVRALQDPPVSEDFRARLKDRFVRGDIPAGAPGLGEAPSEAPTPAPRPAQAPRPAPSKAKIVRFPRPLLAALPLAALLAVALIGVFNRGPAWELGEISGAGTVTVDGRALPSTDLAALASVLKPGAMLMLSDGLDVDLMAPGVCGMQLTGGTSMTLPASPGRWFGRTRDCRLEMGEVRITTGSDFAGSLLHVMTDEAKVEVRGTTLAVIRDGKSTCVCVYSGTVGMSEVAMPPQPVEQGMRKVMYSDTTMAPTVAPLAPMEEMKLRMFQDATEPKLGGHHRK